MIAEILLFMFLCLYHFAEGCTEGYTWAKPTRRKKNRLIQGRMGEGAALIDYHGWRYGENIGIFFSVIIGFYIPTCTDLILTLLGGWLVGSFGFVSTGKMVKEGNQYVLQFESQEDMSSYKKVVITEETEANGLDNNPEAHVLEGNF